MSAASPGKRPVQADRKPYSAPKLRIDPEIDDETKKDLQRQADEIRTRANGRAGER
jgi:hypothetical protein